MQLDELEHYIAAMAQDASPLPDAVAANPDATQHFLVGFDWRVATIRITTTAPRTVATAAISSADLGQGSAAAVAAVAMIQPQ